MAQERFGAVTARVQRPPGQSFTQKRAAPLLRSGGYGLDRGFRRFKNFHTNVLELNNARWTAVQLQAEHALDCLATKVLVHDFSRHLSIHPQRDSRTNANEMIFVPIFQSKPRVL